MSRTIFDQITARLREMLVKNQVTIWERDAEIERLREENNRLRQELEHKAFQDDF